MSSMDDSPATMISEHNSSLSTEPNVLTEPDHQLASSIAHVPNSRIFNGPFVFYGEVSSILTFISKFGNNTAHGPYDAFPAFRFEVGKGNCSWTTTYNAHTKRIWHTSNSH